MKTQILLFLTFIIMFSATGQDQIDKPYDFPIKPGSKKWETLSTGQEMVTVCQIPDSILRKLSTQALAQTCLNYPLFFQYTASNDERKSINEMIDRFNGLRELSLREDGFSKLVNIYKAIPVNKISFLQSNADDVPYKTIYLELLLANEKFIGKANTSELKNIKNTLLTNYNKKLNHQDVHSLYSIRKTLLLGAVIDFKIDSLSSTRSVNKNKIKHFIQNYDTAQPIELTEISKIITANE